MGHWFVYIVHILFSTFNFKHVGNGYAVTEDFRCGYHEISGRRREEFQKFCQRTNGLSIRSILEKVEAYSHTHQ